MPLWLWMAYNKGIQFIDIPFGIVNQINNLRFNKGRELILIANIRKFWDCIMEPDRKRYAIFNFGRTKRGQIQYNVKEDEDLFKERYVVIRKKPSKDKIKAGDRLGIKVYYILVIRPTSIDSEYKRVRVRLIQSDYVVRQKFNVRVM